MDNRVHEQDVVEQSPNQEALNDERNGRQGSLALSNAIPPLAALALTFWHELQQLNVDALQPERIRLGW